MLRFIILFIAIILSFPVHAAKWERLTGDKLMELYDGTVMTGSIKGNQYVIHNCSGGERSILRYGNSEKKERAQTYPNGEEMCNEDDRGNRCYQVFQHTKKPNNLKESFA